MRLVSRLSVASVLLLAFGCAQSRNPKSSMRADKLSAASTGGANGTAAEVAEQAQQEIPLFLASSADMDLKCQPQGELKFFLSEQLSPLNSYLLARFTMIGAQSLPFNQSTLGKWLARFGLQQVNYLENPSKGVRGFVATSSRYNLVVFQGTHSAQGAVTDLKSVISTASPSNIPGGMHKGFKDAYESVSAQLSSALQSGIKNKTPTFFVGHSLGGALAVIASSEQHKAGVHVAGVVTLGQPRVGNQQFTAEFEKVLGGKYVRFVFENDPVPHLPPSRSSGEKVSSLVSGVGGNMFSGVVNAGAGYLFAQADFRHAGQPKTLGHNSESQNVFSDDDSWDEKYWGANSASLTQLVQNPLGALQNPIVADHDVNRYLCAML